MQSRGAYIAHSSALLRRVCTLFWTSCNSSMLKMLETSRQCDIHMPACLLFMPFPRGQHS